MTCFMTVLHRCALHKVRLLVIQDFGSAFFLRTEEKLKHWFDTQSIGKELEGWRERDKSDRYHLRLLKKKYTDKLVSQYWNENHLLVYLLLGAASE